MTTGQVPANRYCVLETIGKGGMGEVCLAEDVLLSRRVALKFVSSPLDSTAQPIERLLAEARAAAALDHPFICKIYEVTEVGGAPCIVMEYVSGETLQRRLRRGPLQNVEALRVAEEAAEALEAAHKRGLVHRDLKPGNLMIADEGHVKVMDFGLAVQATGGPADALLSVTMERPMVFGTPAYMSPEQLRGERPDRRMDIFSYGVVLYEMLTGVHPFAGATPAATVSAVLTSAPREPSEYVSTIPKTLASAVLRMLDKDPATRYPSFADVRLDLRRIAVELTGKDSATPAAPAAPPADMARPGLAGRAAEQAELMRGIRDAVSGRGSVVLLDGDAGAGKTRLAEDALASARSHGFVTLVGRCREIEATSLLSPYVEVLEDASRVLPPPLFREVVGPSAPELSRVMPMLRRVFPEMQAPLELPPDIRQRFLFQQIRDVVARCSQTFPVAIFLDDLQWADEPTLLLTQFLAQHAGRLRLLIIGAYRTEDPEDASSLAARIGGLLQRARGGRESGTHGSRPLSHMVERLLDQRIARVLPVRPLGEDAVGEMLAGIGRRDPPAALVHVFAEQSGGNPFFVEELYRHLAEDGRLFDASGRWRRAAELDAIEVPAGPRALIARRLRRLTRRDRTVLTEAAVIGRRFDLDVLEAVTDAGRDAMMAALDHAERARLIAGPSGRGDRYWHFASQLICDALTRDLTRPRCEQLHLRIARAIERMPAGSPAAASEVAHHLYMAGRAADLRTTVRSLMAAAEAADALYATDEALTHYRHAADVLRSASSTDAERLRVDERMADLLARLGQSADALERYQSMGAALKLAQDDVARARVTRKIGALRWDQGDRKAAIDCYTQARTILEQGDAAAAEQDEAHAVAVAIELAHVNQQLGIAAFRNADNRQAIERAEQALEAGRRAFDSASASRQDRADAAAAMAHATNTIGAALARVGELDEARRRIEDSLDIATTHGLLDVACRAYANLGVVYSIMQADRAIEVSRTGLELATRIGAVGLQSYMYANLATAYCALTDHCETDGLAAARASADLDREIGQLDHLAVPLIVLAQIYQCQGDLQQAQDTYREALSLAERIHEPQLIVPCYDGLATIHLDRGDTARAEAYMQKSRALCDRAALDPDTLLVLPFLC